jgi:hypothetical protein
VYQQQGRQCVRAGHRAKQLHRIILYGEINRLYLLCVEVFTYLPVIHPEATEATGAGEDDESC